MSDTWKKIDLEGGGVHAVNLEFVRRQKKQRTAYWLWLLYPIGGHRFYLNSPLGGALYALSTLLGLLLAMLVGPQGYVVFLAQALFALWDLRLIEIRIAQYNKDLRMALYLSNTKAPPQGYQGRYVDGVESPIADYTSIKEFEKPGVGTAPKNTRPDAKKRYPSFNDQEAMLKELTKNKDKKSPPNVG